MTESRTPLIVVILLLFLPVLHVASYLALVVPGRVLFAVTGPIGETGYLVRNYRWGGETAERVYWPIQQIDRQLRPSVWRPGAWEVELLPVD